MLVRTRNPDFAFIRGPNVPRIQSTRATRDYLAALHRQGMRIYPGGDGQMADIAGGGAVIDNLLGSAQTQIADLKSALTITTAASVAAALAGALLLFRTARR